MLVPAVLERSSSEFEFECAKQPELEETGAGVKITFEVAFMFDRGDGFS